MNLPPTRYAKAGDVNIAYSVLGDGPPDMVFVGGFATHLELHWELPQYQRFATRLAGFSRLVLFDKRGVGLSDPVTEVPTLETRMDDVRAVMDAVGSERAVLFGHSEGAPMAILFAATYPDRTQSLVLYGGMARSTWAPDYPFAAPIEAQMEAIERFMAPNWGTGMNIEIFAPSLADDPKVVEWVAKEERYAASPAMSMLLGQMFLQIDVRDVLPNIHVPTLVLHRWGDHVVNRRAGMYLAEQIPDAKYVELPGNDHMPWAGDTEALLDEVEQFVTGTKTLAEPDRVLATVLFTDIVGSTSLAAEIGDRRWRELLTDCDRVVHREIERFQGRLVKSTGDGHLATFDGPARAIRCGKAIVEGIASVGLELRVGLHAGEIEVMDHDVGGISVHVAARVMSHAGANEVLVSETVKHLVAGSGIQFADRGVHELKGVPDEWRLWTVTAA